MNSSLLQASSLLVRFKDNANNVSAWWCSSVTETGNKKSMLTIFTVCKALKRAHQKTLKGTPIANALILHDISLSFVASKTKNSRTSWCFYYQVPSSTEWDSWRETVRCPAPQDNWEEMRKTFFPGSRLVMIAIWHFPSHFQVFSTFHKKQCSLISFRVLFSLCLSCDWTGEVSSYATASTIFTFAEAHLAFPLGLKCL